VCDSDPFRSDGTFVFATGDELRAADAAPALLAKLGSWLSGCIVPGPPPEVNDRGEPTARLVGGRRARAGPLRARAGQYEPLAEVADGEAPLPLAPAAPALAVVVELEGAPAAVPEEAGDPLGPVASAMGPR